MSELSEERRADAMQVMDQYILQIAGEGAVRDGLIRKTRSQLGITKQEADSLCDDLLDSYRRKLQVLAN